MGHSHSKPTPLETMLKIFKKGFSGNYNVTMTPEELRVFYREDWPAFGVEGTLDRSLVSKVRHKIIYGKLEHLDQFPYIDLGLQLVLNPPKWLREQAATVLVAKGQTARNYHPPCLQETRTPKVQADSVAETTPKVLVNTAAKEFLSMMPPPPPQRLPAPGPEALASPPELHTPKSPRVDKRECGKTPPIAARFPEGTPPLAARLRPKAWVQMPLREQRYTGVDKDSHMVEKHVFMYLPFTSADLINWKNNNLSYSEKLQTLINLLQTIIQTYNPIWADCQQLLMHLFNTDERRRILQAASNWLEEHVPADYQNPRVCQGTVTEN
ncbi:Gag polyprotein [Plecturocebus cupreus]